MNCQIELSSKCQLTCVECPQRLMKRKRTFMTDEVFEKALEYINQLENKEKELGYPPTIILHKDGEPLLHPKLEQYITRIAELRPEFRLNLYTNGLLLTEKFVEFLSELPNRIWLLVSFHFFNADGSKNDYEHTTKVIQYGIEKNYPNIDFVLTSHVTRFCPEEDLHKWENSWLKYSGKGNWYCALNKHINPWTGLIKEDNCVTFDSCPYGDFGHLFIGSTGNVIPCCMVLEEDIIFGNIMTDSKENIFKKAEQFYKNLNSKVIVEPICKRCMA